MKCWSLRELELRGSHARFNEHLPKPEGAYRLRVQRVFPLQQEDEASVGITNSTTPAHAEQNAAAVSYEHVICCGERVFTCHAHQSKHSVAGEALSPPRRKLTPPILCSLIYLEFA